MIIIAVLSIVVIFAAIGNCYGNYKTLYALCNNIIQPIEIYPV